ncbi:MAG TPA: acyl carrier protein [Kofleriaceae bacterium]
MASDILVRLRSYILSTFLPGEDPTSLTDDTPLLSAGIIDSLAVLDMVSFIEKEFAVRLEQEDLGRDRLDTIALIGALIEERRGSSPLA